MDLQHRLEALYQQALTFKTKGNVEEAGRVEAEAAVLLKNLQRQIEQDPDSLETAAALLFLAERDWTIRGDDPAVQTMIERAIRIRERQSTDDPASLAEALTLLAEFHFLAGRWGEAEPLYRRAVDLCEKNPSARVYAKCCGGLAQTLTHLGRPKEADPFFAKAIERCGSSAEDKRVLYFLYTYRADGLEKAGLASEAEALRALAQGLLPRGNPGEAGFHV